VNIAKIVIGDGSIGTGTEFEFLPAVSKCASYDDVASNSQPNRLK
jgi:hypothetical protein